MAIQSMSTADSARLAYPVMVEVAKTLSLSMRERKQTVWVTHEDLVRALKDLGIKETARTVTTKLLKPLQQECIAAGVPDLSALIVRKAKGDFGDLLKPAPGWWEAYEAVGLCKGEDVGFWFNKYKEARDHAWPTESGF